MDPLELLLHKENPFMKRLLTSAVFVFACLFVFVGQAADYRFKVFVGVTCDDPNTKAFIESHIKRDLRSLHDVDIIGNPENAVYFLTIVAVEPTVRGSVRKMGDIAIAYCYFQRNTIPGFMINTIPNAEYRKHIKSGNKLSFYEPTSGVHTGMTNIHLERICKGIVVKFDTLFLEPMRAIYQR